MKLKKFLSIMTASLLIVTAVPTAAFAEDATVALESDSSVSDSKQAVRLIDIGNVWVFGVDENNRIAFTAETNPNSDCPNQMDIVEEVWTSTTDGSQLSSVSGGAATEGHKYTYAIKLKAKDGYYFDDSFEFVYGGTTYEHNDLALDISDDGSEITIGFQFLGEVDLFDSRGIDPSQQYDVTEVSTIYIDNVNKTLTAGSVPTFTGTSREPSVYYVQFEVWSDADGNWISSKDIENSYFPSDKKLTSIEAGKTYYYGLYISTVSDEETVNENGDKVVKTNYFTPDITVYVNDEVVYKDSSEEDRDFNDYNNEWNATLVQLFSVEAAAGNSTDINTDTSTGDTAVVVVPNSEELATIQSASSIAGATEAGLPQDVQIVVNAVEAEEDVQAAESFLTENKLTEMKNVLVDIKLESQGVVLTTQPNGKIAVTVPVFENLKTAKYVEVFRKNETTGKFESLGVSEVKDSKITFESDHFSTYLFVETDKAADTEIATTTTATGQTTTAANTSPKTGDTAPVMLLSILAVVCAGMVAFGKKLTKKS